MVFAIGVKTKQKLSRLDKFDAMKNWSKGKKILVGLLLLFAAAQAIQPTKNQGSKFGPKDITHVVQVPDSVITVLQKSCYDCHSDSTTYPWYDRVAPVSWWIGNHISEGKRHLNFSTFGELPAKKQAKKLDETADEVDHHEMPIGSYTFIHTDTKLSDAQRKLLIDWAKSAEATVEASAK